MVPSGIFMGLWFGVVAFIFAFITAATVCTTVGLWVAYISVSVLMKAMQWMAPGLHSRCVPAAQVQKFPSTVDQA